MRGRDMAGAAHERSDGVGQRARAHLALWGCRRAGSLFRRSVVVFALVERRELDAAGLRECAGRACLQCCLERQPDAAARWNELLRLAAGLLGVYACIEWRPGRVAAVASVSRRTARLPDDDLGFDR